MAAVVAKVGVRRAQRLWVHLLAVEEASPEDLAWLVLLACWFVPAIAVQLHGFQGFRWACTCGQPMLASAKASQLTQRICKLRMTPMKCAGYESCGGLLAYLTPCCLQAQQCCGSGVPGCSRCDAVVTVDGMAPGTCCGHS